jgi:predicted nucleic acid-binding protein
LRRRVLFDTGFFHVYFSGLNDEAKRAVEEVYSGKSVGYTLDLNLAEFLYYFDFGPQIKTLWSFRISVW